MEDFRGALWFALISGTGGLFGISAILVILRHPEFHIWEMDGHLILPSSNIPG
jgi:hypothetical protein